MCIHVVCAQDIVGNSLMPSAYVIFGLLFICLVVWVCALEVVRHCGERHLGCHVCIVIVRLFGCWGV